ncbi:MAG TPA: hypothetical protein VFR99_11840 [Marmoricola sp.]|nr:hypothetical protein [Marmoricola sp.]
MPVPTTEVSGAGSLGWLLAVAVASFLVSWLLTERVRLGHTAYVAALAGVSAALTGGYLAWSGISLADLLTDAWGWALLAGVLSGALTGFGITRLAPSLPGEHGTRLAGTLAWQGVLYGVSEGTLLSMLPALVVWEWVNAAGWSGTWGAVGRFVLPLLASVAVIVVHHLGYAEFRNPRMVLPVIGCGVLTVAFLATGNAIAPALGHVLMHTAAVLHRTELPPQRHPVAV